MKFDYSKNIVLEDDRVLIRPIAEDDITHLHKISSTEPNLWQYSQLNAAGAVNLKNYVASAIKNRLNKLQYTFIVFDKLKNAYAGSTRLYEIDSQRKNIFIGYTFYGKDFQGTGLNKHAKYLLFQFVFETLEFERIELRAHTANAKSIAAMKSVGCTVEGVLRKNIPATDGERRDSIVLSILKDEWLQSVKQTLKNKLETK